jgi:hypothetical protein
MRPHLAIGTKEQENRHAQASRFAGIVLKGDMASQHKIKASSMPHCYAWRVERISLGFVQIDKRYDVRWFEVSNVQTRFETREPHFRDPAALIR